MSKMVKNVEIKEIYLKLYYFLKKLLDTMYIINPRTFNWRNQPMSMCPCPCPCPWTWTWTGTNGHMDICPPLLVGWTSATWSARVNVHVSLSVPMSMVLVFYSTFCPIRRFVSFDVLYHSAFFPFDVSYYSTFCPIRHFFHSMFCPIRHFFHLPFCPIWHFVF
jgi:hypothetical protein